MEDDDKAIEGRLIPWRNADREWLGIIVVFRDVTYQVKAEKARNNSITALSRSLRGPLSIIKGYAELIITDNNTGGFNDQQFKAQQIIYSNAERMAETLDNALQISLQNKRELLPNFEEVDVKSVIDEVVYEMNPMIQLTELKLVQDVKADLPHITADPRHLYRILENLMSNACRFTPPGGQITLRAWVQHERKGNSTRPFMFLAVSDNGVGLPPTEYKRIFDPFYQLGAQNPDAKPGLGMGLAVVKELVEWHNGRVWVESSVGQGSIFQVSIPIRPH
jgi:signal transduction histidine kinase